jgi:glutathione peroxidase
MSFYDLKTKTASGKEIDFKEFKDHPVLIINTATQCGLTPQFTGLEQIHQEFKEQGLKVIGFPCNQFMGQEPLSDEDMENTCQLNHGVTFPLTAKIDVNGRNTDPVFKHLKKEKGGILGSNIKWNFTKFLIDKNGSVIKRYAPTTKPEQIIPDIKKVI